LREGGKISKKSRSVPAGIIMRELRRRFALAAKLQGRIRS
jgi:hypothetical protein